MWNPTSGSEAFELAFRTCQEAAETPCPPNTGSLMPYVADEEQQEYLGAARLTELKKKLYKWPIEAAVIAAKAKQVAWPVSVRSYVKGMGTCIGLTSGLVTSQLGWSAVFFLFA